MSWLSCCFALLSLVVMCHSQGNSYSLTECNAQKNFDIVENHETSMTCTGLISWHHVHWNITGPATNSVETTVARCEECRTVQPCGGVCSSSNPNYEISRNLRSTTLQFKNNLTANNGAVVKCSNFGKNLQASCNINVIKAYKIDKCVNNEVKVIENKATTIRCSGLDASQNMYWKATDLDGNSVDIAQCGHCLARASCNTCRIANSHLRVTRSREFSVLQVIRQDVQKSGWTLTCSKKDDATQDECKIRVEFYNMPQCQNGTLQILETQPQTPIRCEGLKYRENMNWTVTDNSGSTSEIAKCLDYYRNNRCSNTDADFSASRNETVGQLVIQNYARDKVVNKTLTCIRRDGTRRDSCRIRVVYPAEISTWSVTLNGWTVTATAVIEKVYDSNEDVFCLWNLTGPNSIEVIEIDRPQFSTFLENRRVYYNGHCSLSILANATEGVYHVSVTVLPAGGTIAVGNVTFNQPETPEDNTDVPVAFIAGGSVAAAVVIVFIVVIVVIIVKRKDKTYGRPRRRRGLPEHTYSDLHPDNNTATQPLNTAPNSSQNTADNTAPNAAHDVADNTAFNTAPGTSPDTETGRVYLNTLNDGASGGAVYYNETSDTQTAPSSDGQDADHYYIDITDLPPVELNGSAALTREADPGMNMSLYEEIK